MRYHTRLLTFLLVVFLTGCLPTPRSMDLSGNFLQTSTPSPSTTQLPTRPLYSPGELVDYNAQEGDNLPALAKHFNTTVPEIRTANPIIPIDATTMPPGMPMKIPIYYQSLWGTQFHILPDSLFVNGPADVGFDSTTFVDSQPGWLKYYVAAAGGVEKRGGEMVDYVATNFSISPRLLLAIIDMQSGALSVPATQVPDDPYPLGNASRDKRGLYAQLLWEVNVLNNGYYGWRIGRLSSFDHNDGRMERPDPWQNAATVAIQYYFSKVLDRASYEKATNAAGLLKTYQDLFNTDPWKSPSINIPGSLAQPALRFPFLPGKTWAFTGGPHTGWGDGDPFAAVDFAPPAVKGGCIPTEEWATAAADGVISRSGSAIVVLDLDGDGDERTGWVIFYLHLATNGLIAAGTHVKAGDPLGHPSCEGGKATGTHVHIARKYNGEWIPADGTLAFDLEGWTAHNGAAVYKGTLTKFTRTVIACDCSNQESLVHSEIVQH